VTLAELLVATAITATCAGIVAGALQAAGEASRLQPERGEVQQRLRIGVGAVRDRLALAGLGVEGGAAAGTLARRVPVLFPHRRGMPGAEAPATVASDRVTIYSVPAGGTYVPLAAPMAGTSASLVLTNGPGCPAPAPACRFAAGQLLLAFDATGTHDVFVAAAVWADGVQPDRTLSVPYDPALGAAVVPLEVAAIGLDTTTAQLRLWGPGGVGQPLLDDVVGFSLEYLADPAPPLLPRPPPGVPSCIADEAGAPLLPAFPADWGTLHLLTAPELRDGPVCGAGANTYDADLLRLRAVLVTLRVQAASASVRGRDPALFARPGAIRDRWRTVPDEVLTFQVSPANLAPR
jgi:hypothetical protein